MGLTTYADKIKHSELRTSRMDFNKRDRQKVLLPGFVVDAKRLRERLDGAIT